VVERAGRFVEAGADAIFAEAMTDIDMYKPVVEVARVPVLANLTEFGQTPLYTALQLRDVGISMALYPLSAFRAMSKAALAVYSAIRNEGTQASVVNLMQTRMELYDHLGYHEYEKKLDELFQSNRGAN
jgi:methylisocitrate lyase